MQRSSQRQSLAHYKVRFFAIEVFGSPPYGVNIIHKKPDSANRQEEQVDCVMSVDDHEKPALFDPSPLVIHPLEPIPPGRYRQSRFQKISETLMSWIFFTAVIVGGLYYGVHLLLNYIHLEKEFRENSAKIAHPRVFENQASDIGYIYSMRRETLVREGKLNLVWFVVVPSTNVHYSCPYEYGYPDFKTGDSVRLIHTTSEDEGDYGYIVGLHDQEQGKATAIWNFDLDTAELDDIPDNN